MALHRLVDIEIGVPEPSALDTFYAQIGFTGHPGAWGGEETPDQIRLTEAPYRQLRSIRVACHDEEDLALAAARLTEIGVTPEQKNGTLTVVDPINEWRIVVEPAAEQTLPVHEPRLVNYPGQRVRVGQRADIITEAQPRKPRRLGHVVVGSPEPQKTVALFQALGYRISDTVFGGVGTFMRCSPDHHNLLVAPGPVPYLNHYAIEQDDFDTVMKAATTYLVDNGQDKQIAGPGRHQIGGNVFWYMLDPAGNIFEFFTDMDQIVDDDAWQAEDWTTHDAWSVWGEKQQPEVFFAPTDMPDIVAGWQAAHA